MNGRHSLEEAQQLFPGILEEDVKRVLSSLAMYDNLEEYFTTNHVPAGIDQRNFRKCLFLKGHKDQPRYTQHQGFLYKVEYKHGKATSAIALFRTLQEVRMHACYYIRV